MGTEKKTHARPAFPTTKQPTVVIFETAYQLVDISVKVIKIHLRPDDHLRFPRGSSLNALIMFHDGESLSVEGSVLRVDKKEVVLLLASGIHSARIFKERQYLIERGPGRK